MNKLGFFILFVSVAVPIVHGDNGNDTISLTLDETIIRARAESVDAAVALNELKTAYWEYRTYRAELLPEISFNATLPSYHKQYSTYMNDEGNYSFVRNNYLQMNGELSVSQNIWLTGGTLSLNTSLDFLRQLDGDKYNRFMSIPVALTLNQPIFGVNSIKWDRRIEPVRYSEAKSAFLTATEEVAMTAINYYFSLLMSTENMSIARQNLENAEKLHEVAKVKREMGKISKNDLLQMELNLLNAQSAMTDCQSTAQSDMFKLCSFLGYNASTYINTHIPSHIPLTEINYQDAIDKALANNKLAKNLRRRQLEADYAVAKAKGEMREISLFAQVGFTGTDHIAGRAYSNLKDNQVVEIGVKIPLVDWGRRKGNVKVAQSNRDVVESRLRQEMQNFNQDLFILVERFSNQKKQLEIASRADEIAQQRYKTNIETFLIGKISTLDLNDSQVKKDEARREYVNQLFRYWYYFYQLRSLTLWDFENSRGIDADIEKIVKQ